MATILIDKLLSACVKQGASDIHITVGQPPVFRLHGRMRKLETKVLEPDDTVTLQFLGVSANWRVSVKANTQGSSGTTDPRARTVGLRFFDTVRGETVHLSCERAGQ